MGNPQAIKESLLQPHNHYDVISSGACDRTVELLQVAGGELSLRGPLWSFLAELDFETLGFLVVGHFGATWLASIFYWKYRKFDEPMTLDPRPG